MNLLKYTVNHEVIKLNTDIDDITANISKNILYLDKLPTFTKRLVLANDNLAIKFIEYDIDKNNILKPECKDSEIFLINQYLNKKFNHPYFLPYIGLTKIINFNQEIVKDSSESSSESVSDVSSDIKLTNINKIIKNEYITLVRPMNIGIIMAQCTPLEIYLFENKDLDYIYILTNIYNILDLAILIRDKYEMIHCDVKIDNVVVNNNKFYLIDWENTFESDEKYYHDDRPTDGNSEMYPHYDTNSEQFFVYSIGVLITRIIGFHYGVTYNDFKQNMLLHYILSKIPSHILRNYDDLLINIFVIKINKIEVLKDKIYKIINTQNG